MAEARTSPLEKRCFVRIPLEALLSARCSLKHPKAHISMLTPSSQEQAVNVMISIDDQDLSSERDTEMIEFRMNEKGVMTSSSTRQDSRGGIRCLSASASLCGNQQTSAEMSGIPITRAARYGQHRAEHHSERTQMTRRFVSVKELAEELGVHADTIYRAHVKNLIPVKKVCKVLRFDLEKVLRAFAAHERARPARAGDAHSRNAPDR